MTAERMGEPAPSPALAPAGESPLVEVEGILAKLECVHASGSIKDRVARYLLDSARREGTLAPGQRIVEASSGNTGIALAWHGRALGHPVTIVMPENMTEERKTLIRELGADLILCSAEGSFAEAAAIRDQLARQHGWHNPDQFSNPKNVECHARTTGAELLRQLNYRNPERRIDAFVAGIGTGGTLLGVGRALREAGQRVWLVAVEPEESAVLSGRPAGDHGISGIGDGFVPAIASDGAGGVHPAIDEVARVTTAEATTAAYELGWRHGLCVGISSGANFVVARRIAARGLSVATVFADGFARYRSRGLTPCDTDRCPFEKTYRCAARAAEAGVPPGPEGEKICGAS
jgi:cysteine synthase A